MRGFRLVNGSLPGAVWRRLGSFSSFSSFSVNGARSSSLGRRFLSSASGGGGGEERYARPLRYLHWIGSAGITFCVVSALAAQSIPTDKEDPAYDEDKAALRGRIMRLHESFGVLMLAAMVPRVAVRLASRIPAPLPGTAIEHIGAKLSHGFLYFALIFMPVSGVSFSYFSGWSTPFFKWDIPGAPKEDIARYPSYKRIEDFMYAQHHNVGKVLTYVLPVHVGATAYHVMRGHKIFARMNPFVH